MRRSNNEEEVNIDEEVLRLQQVDNTTQRKQRRKTVNQNREEGHDRLFNIKFMNI